MREKSRDDKEGKRHEAQGRHRIYFPWLFRHFGVEQIGGALTRRFTDDQYMPPAMATKTCLAAARILVAVTLILLVDRKCRR